MVNSYYGIYQAEPGQAGLRLDLPCTEDPELFFAESPQDVEQAKMMCQGCQARLACLAGALERGEPWGVWGGELLLRGVIVPRKRPRGRPRKDVVAVGALPVIAGLVLIDAHETVVMRKQPRLSHRNPSLAVIGGTRRSSIHSGTVSLGTAGIGRT